MKKRVKYILTVDFDFSSQDKIKISEMNQLAKEMVLEPYCLSTRLSYNPISLVRLKNET